MCWSNGNFMRSLECCRRLQRSGSFHGAARGRQDAGGLQAAAGSAGEAFNGKIQERA